MKWKWNKIKNEKRNGEFRINEQQLNSNNGKAFTKANKMEKKCNMYVRTFDSD